MCLSRNLNTFWSDEESHVIQSQNKLLQYTLETGSRIQLGENRIEDLILDELNVIDRTLLKSLYRKIGLIFEGNLYFISQQLGP